MSRINISIVIVRYARDAKTLTSKSNHHCAYIHNVAAQNSIVDGKLFSGYTFDAPLEVYAVNVLSSKLST